MSYDVLTEKKRERPMVTFHQGERRYHYAHCDVGDFVCQGDCTSKVSPKDSVFETGKKWMSNGYRTVAIIERIK